jgi:hypothetical protein
MAGSLSDFMEKRILDLIFGNTAYTVPTTLYFGLSTTTIADSATGTTGITEPSGNAYARASVANNTTNFPVSTGTAATKTTGADITFATPTGSWGTVTDFFIADALTAGNILCYGNLGASQTISSGNTVKFSTGSLTITLE